MGEFRKISRAEMAARTARFAQVKMAPKVFLDMALPEYDRELYNVIGPAGANDMATEAAIPSDGFNVAYVRAEPGKGTGPHTHPVVEAFIPVSGRWAVYWGEGAERDRLELDPLDCCSVPPGVVRGFTNISDAPALLIAIVGGTGREGVDWAQELLDSAAASGWRLGAGGRVERG